MLGIQIRQQRFNLYQMDEGELFIKDFAAKCQFLCPETNQVENLQGIMHFCSRGIIFEPDDSCYSIFKFHFRFIPDRPKVVIIEGKEIFKLIAKKIILIPLGKATQPHQICEVNTDVFIHFLFEKVNLVAEIFYELLDKFNTKQTVFEFDSVEYLGNLYNFKFDYTRIKSIHEKFLLKSELFCKMLLPLIEIPGLLMITDLRIYFQPLFSFGGKKCYSLKHALIDKLFKRRNKLRDLGLEISAMNQTKQNNRDKAKIIFLQFEHESDREMLYDLIYTHVPQDFESNLTIDNCTKNWIEGKMSNYDYIIALNSASNRTRYDLSQYPIFPWVLSNYTSTTLDLNDVSNFRDLSKPIGALNPKRLEMFRERFRQMPEPKFLYGTHYSSPAYVIGYLVRKYPQFMIKLHGGKFDHPDRLFNSIEVDWDICLNNPGCVKELIPEFYEENPDFLLNLQNIDFGSNNKNEKIHDVKLPPWASDASSYLSKMKEALESNYVSSNLHKWIDLIFGYKQRGQNAVDNNNLFHPFTYETGLPTHNDIENRKIMELQINEFGQVPKQLFKNPHPKKYSSETIDVQIKLDESIIDASNEKDKLITDEDGIKTEVSSITEDKASTVNVEDVPFRYDVCYNFAREYTTLTKFHKKRVTSSVFLYENKTFVTASHDGYIKVFDYKTAKIKRMINVGTFPLTSMVGLNQSNLIAIGSTDNMVHFYNTSLGKEVNSFFAHEDSVLQLHYNPNKGVLLTTGEDCTYKLWDMGNNTKLPVHVYYDTETKIISTDYRVRDELFMLIDEDGMLSIRKLNEEKSIEQIKLNKGHYKFCKFDHVNENQYYVASSTEFKIFDIRTHLQLDSIDYFNDSINIFNDSKSYLLVKENELALYHYDNNKVDKINHWPFDKITHANVSLSNYTNPEVILIGTDSGDVMFSYTN